MTAERATGHFRDERETGQTEPVAHIVPATEGRVGDFQKIREKQAKEHAERARRQQQGPGARKARLLGWNRRGDQPRVRRFDRCLLHGLLHPSQHRLQQRARCLRVAFQRVQRHLRLIAFFLRRPHCSHPFLQGRDTLPVRPHFGLRGGNHAGDFRRHRPGRFGKLALQGERVGMARAVAGEQGLQLSRQQVLLRPQRRDRGGYGSLIGGTGLATRRIQPGLDLGQIVTSLHEIGGKPADLFGLQTSLHPFYQAIPGTVGSDAVLGDADIAAQFHHPPFQPLGGVADGGEFRFQLVADIQLRDEVGGRGGQLAVLRGEGDLQHAGRLWRVNRNHVPHGDRRQRRAINDVRRGGRRELFADTQTRKPTSGNRPQRV